jgi:hypothetical protein
MGLAQRIAAVRQQYRETEVPLPDGTRTANTKKARAAYKADREAAKQARRKR